MKEWFVLIDLEQSLGRWSVWHDRIDNKIQPMLLDTLEGCIERFSRGLGHHPEKRDRYYLVKWDTCEIIPCCVL